MLKKYLTLLSLNAFIILVDEKRKNDERGKIKKEGGK